MDNGWIKLYRSLMYDPVWTSANAEQKVVLVTILLLASHEPRQWVWMGQKFELQPGQFVTSLDSLSRKAGVSIRSVRSAIARFEKLNFLTNKSTKTGRLISIVNWSTYQGPHRVPDKASDKEPTKTRQLSIKKEGKKEKPLSGFDDFWLAYPKKQSKQQALTAWTKLDPDDDLQSTILSALDMQSTSDQWQRDGGQYIPLASSWLNQQRWEDELDRQSPQAAQLINNGMRVY